MMMYGTSIGSETICECGKKKQKSLNWCIDCTEIKAKKNKIKVKEIKSRLSRNAMRYKRGK